MNSERRLSMLLSVLFASACSSGSPEAHTPASLEAGGASCSASAGAAGAQAGDAGESADDAHCDAPWPAQAPTLKSDTWTSLNPSTVKFTGEPQDGPFVQGFAIDPCNSSTLYLCVDSFDPAQGGGLYKSLDAGATWKKIGPLDEPVRVRVDPKDPLHLYVADGVRGDTLGFWVSKDGGDTWLKPDGWKALSPSVYVVDDLYDVAVDPADFSHALVTFHSPWVSGTAGQNAGVLETKDGGDTWTAHQPQSTWGAGLNIWFLSNAKTWLLGTQADGYWRTEDSGATWVHVSTTPMFHGGGQLYKAKTGVLYLSSSTGVLRSSDDGVTWTSVGSVPPATSVFGDGTRLYTHSAYLIGSEPFYTSKESDGLTWTQLNSQAWTDGPFEMAFDAKQGIVYSANWGNGLIALKVPPRP